MLRFPTAMSGTREQGGSCASCSARAGVASGMRSATVSASELEVVSAQLSSVVMSRDG